jgi:uncharacterized protein
MKNASKSITGAVFILCFAAGATAGTLEDAVAAAQKGDYATAHQMLRPLANKGDARAQFDLGQLYANGWGVRRDFDIAVGWYSKAAEQGLAIAQYNLGVAYANGDGVPQDDREAGKWYRLAADQGDAAAQLNLGIAYANGWGVPHDLTNAYMWTKSSMLRYVPTSAARFTASKSLKKISQDMTSVQIAEAQKLSSEWNPRTQPGTTSDRQIERQLLTTYEYYGELADASVWPVSAVGTVTVSLSFDQRKSCTGVVVAPKLVITVADCFFNNKQLVRPANVRFIAGLNRAVVAVAERIVVSKEFAPGPWDERIEFISELEFTPGSWDPEVVATNWAVVVLDKAVSINPISIQPVAPGEFLNLSKSGSVVQIGFGIPRKYLPSIVRDCRVSATSDDKTFIYRCLANWGYSGAPIIADINGTPSVIGIGSSLYKGWGLATSTIQFQKTVTELTHLD